MLRHLRTLAFCAWCLGLWGLWSTAHTQTAHAQTAVPSVTPTAGWHQAPPLIGLREDRDRHIQTPQALTATGALAKTPTSSINVTYFGVADPWPEAARAAFEHAVAIWERILVSPVPIEVEAAWDELGTCDGRRIVLGAAGPFLRSGWPNVTPPPGAFNDTWYPLALANALHGFDLNPGDPDVGATFNSACDNGTWYYGRDGQTPNGQVDFVSVVLHELAHGFGYNGSAQVAEGVGRLRFGPQAVRPLVYDRYVEDGAGTALLTYPNDSSELAEALTGQVGGVFFRGSTVDARTGGGALLHAPLLFQAGSSYAHLSEGRFDRSESTLMTPALRTSEAIHTPGAVGCAVLADLGWPLNSLLCTRTPVELDRFEVTLDTQERTVALTWDTRSETFNEGFSLEQRYGQAPFAELRFVPGMGTTEQPQTYAVQAGPLQPGRYTFRLRLLDLSGRAVYGPEVDIRVPLEGLYDLSAPYPNPVRGTARVDLFVADRQWVELKVYDVTGRMVQSVFEGILSNVAERSFEISTYGLPPGLYFVRAEGARFAGTQPLTVLR